LVVVIKEEEGVDDPIVLHHPQSRTRTAIESSFLNRRLQRKKRQEEGSSFPQLLQSRGAATGKEEEDCFSLVVTIKEGDRKNKEAGY
jgi:hypothetical protein